jgi:hypothetical protein
MVTIFATSIFLTVAVSAVEDCSVVASKSVDIVTSTPILPKHFLPLSFMGGVSGLVDPKLRLGALVLSSIFAESFSPLATDSANESVDITTSSLSFCLTEGVSGRVEMQLRLVTLSLASFAERLPSPFDCTSLRESVDMAVTSLSFLFLLIPFPGGVSDLLTEFLLGALPTVAALPLPDPSPLDVERLIAGDDVREESEDEIMVFPVLRGIAPDLSGVPILDELELVLCFTDLDLF